VSRDKARAEAGLKHASALPGACSLAGRSPAARRQYGPGIPTNSAVTAFAASIATTHVSPLAVVHPVHPPNISTAFVAVRVMLAGGVVRFTTVEHPAVEPVEHEIPGPVTVPVPVPTRPTVSETDVPENVAVTVLAADIVTVHTFPETVEHPLHDVNVEGALGVAVSVTTVAGDVFGTVAVQPAVEPVVQEIPGPLTVPTPVPDVRTVSAQVAGWNVAVTDLAPVIETVQVLPEKDVHPLHDQRMEPGFAAAVSVTLVAGVVFATLAVQPDVDPVVHEIPGPVTVPAPVPEVRTVSVQVAGWNVAMTDFAAVIETVQVLPEKDVHPDHDVRIEFASGAAVSVTLVAGVVFATPVVHPAADPVVQEIPGPVTVPRPVPDVPTVSVQ
jgi:hypothetical protein